jgi:hypothetical protein
MAKGIREVVDLPDPVGKVIDTVTRPNGLVIRKVRAPMGVVAIIYESRPNVTSDAAALALKSGNVCVLRGGKEAFLSANAKKAGVETTASGLQYKIEAPGAEYKVAPQDTVWVNYKGELLDGTVFDQNDSMQFVANRVIKGWTEGLGLLGEGGKATLYIPASLGYGERGTRGIAPNSTLIFDVEVLKIGKFVPKEEK